MAPKDELKADRESLLLDAHMWNDAADGMAGPHTEVTQLHLAGGPDFSGLGARMGLHISYGQARNRMEDLMAGAIEYFDEIADTLRDIEAFYGEQEAGHVERFAQAERQKGD